MSITNGPILDDEAYRLLCQQFFFADDETAGDTLLALTSKATPEDNARLQTIQAQVRSRWHTHKSRERRKSFFDLLAKIPSETKFDPVNAKKKLAELVKSHCTADEPGTQPFFLAIYSLIELQARSSWRRGAGPFRCEWEIDDAVWIEVGKTGFLESALDFVANSLSCKAISTREAEAISTTEAEAISTTEAEAISTREAEAISTREAEEPVSETTTTPSKNASDAVSIQNPTDSEYTLERRTWIMPSEATNTQLRPLLRKFPRAIIAKARKGSHGTGEIWISEQRRNPGWQGPLYSRVWYWYRYFVLLGWLRWNTGILVR